MTTAPARPLRRAPVDAPAPPIAPAPSIRRAERRRRLLAWMIPLAIFLAAFVPRVQSVGMPSADEPTWLRRSVHYLDAYTSLNLTNATSISVGKGTMPGITTAAVGATARVIWSASRGLGLADDRFAFAASRRGLEIAQTLVALLNALLVVVLWWVLRRWINRRVATVAAVILATEPFLIVHGARLTTDSFVALFGAIGTFAAAAALGIPRVEHDVRHRRALAVVAGLGLAGAIASKLSFLAVAPFLVLLLVLAAWRPPRLERRELVGVLLVIAASAVVLLAVLWPALFLDPVGQITVMRTSAKQVGIQRTQFFLGEATTDPGVFFYPVVLAFRSTPWLFLLTLASPVAVWFRRTRPYAVLMLLYAAVPFLVITWASLKYDRYSLPLWPAAAVLAALVVEVGVISLLRRVPSTRRIVTPALAGILAVLALATMAVVPDAGVYANPLLGGGEAAQDAIIIGGPSVSRAGELIADREGDHCDDIRVFATMSRGTLRFPCGDVVGDLSQLRSGDYIVVDMSSLSRGRIQEASYLARGSLVAHVRRRGVDLADIIVVR